MTTDWRELLVKSDETIRGAIACIDRGQQKLALVIDQDDRLVGIVSDGDVRRALLRGAKLTDPAISIMNKEPLLGSVSSTQDELQLQMRSKRLSLIPIVDDHRRVLGVELLDHTSLSGRYDNIVILMAGGLGLRLRPLTETVPKPLLTVGGRPILEIILTQFIAQGFSRFYISINYLGGMISEYFGDGSRFGVSITYIKETSRLGTAGALGLLPQPPSQPFIVINGDLLTKLRFDTMLEFHEQQHAQATLGVLEYGLEVPFGVVTTKGGFVSSIDEKPIHPFFINGGVYVLDPGVLRFVEPERAIDMPQLLMSLINEGNHVAAFPIREYWIDLGRHDDFKRAELEFTA